MSNSTGFAGLFDAAGRRLDDLRLWLTHQWAQTFDANQWASGTTLKDKLSAVSLPHAGAGLTVIGAVVVGGLFLFGGPRGPSPPPLPSETARESIRSATRAFEGELSPALAAANAPVEGSDR